MWELPGYEIEESTVDVITSLSTRLLPCVAATL
jgi:hypothetical protein